jgi:hypothetical protein
MLPASSARIQCSARSSLHVAYPPSRSATTSSPIDEDQYVYIPQSELDEAIRQEKKRHQKECDDLQSVIEHQKQELQRLKETERKERLKHKMYHDACWAENLQMLWSENHTEKMNRFQGRLEYLTEENLHLQSKLQEEKKRHAQEIEQLHDQLQQEKEKTQEAKDILGLERAYYETSVRLLEAGLEREGHKVKSLQAKLKVQKERMERRQGRRHEEPLPQRNLQSRPSFEEQLEPPRKHYRHQIFEVQQLREQQQHSQDSQQYRRHQPHENQYFEQFQYQQQHQQEPEYEYVQRQPEPEPQQQQQQQQYHSDQFGFENAHYSNLQEQQQQQRPQNRRTQRYQPPSDSHYYSERSSPTVNEERYQQVAHSRRRPRPRTAIPTMNGQHLGGGFNDMRNRLY